MKKVIIGLIIVILVGGMITFKLMQGNGDNATTVSGVSISKGPIINVYTTAVVEGEISSSISVGGRVEAVEKDEIYFDAPLKVAEVLVKENQRVKKGDVLLSVDLWSIESELKQMKINKSIQQLSLEKIKSSEGMSSMDAQIQISMNNFLSAQSNYDNLKSTYENNIKLYEMNAISKNELELSKTRVEEAETSLKNADINYQSTLKGQSMDYNIAKLNLSLLEAQISNLEEKVRRIKETCISKIDGMVINVNVTKSGYTPSMQPAFVIYNDKIQVRATVGEYNLKDIKVGQKVKISGDALGEEVTVNGTLDSISSIAQINASSGGSEAAVEVLVSVEPSSIKMKPGINVDCNVLTQQKDNALKVSLDAFTEDKDGNQLAYIVDSEMGIVHEVVAEFGIISDQEVELLKGFKKDDIIVKNPSQALKEGSRVKVVE